MEKINITTLWVRFISQTPRFWKKVQKIALSLGGSGTAVMVANNSLNLTIHPNVITVVSYIVAVSAAIACTAQFTKIDK